MGSGEKTKRNAKTKETRKRRKKGSSGGWSFGVWCRAGGQKEEECLVNMERWIFLILLVIRNFGVASAELDNVHRCRPMEEGDGERQLARKRRQGKDPRTDENEGQERNAKTSEGGEVCLLNGSAWCTKRKFI